MSNTNISNSITIGGKWFMPGFLNLKELNSLLLKYIGQVQDLELNQNKPGANNSITVNIDRWNEILIDLLHHLFQYCDFKS